MKSIDLEWSTTQAIYRAKDGEVIEGKYVRISGSFTNLRDPSTFNTDRVEMIPIFQVVFRNLADDTLYFISRVMLLDTEKSKDSVPVFHHPFEQTASSADVFSAYAVERTQRLAGTFYSGSVPN